MLRLFISSSAVQEYWLVQIGMFWEIMLFRSLYQILSAPCRSIAVMSSLFMTTFHAAVSWLLEQSLALRNKESFKTILALAITRLYFYALLFEKL